MYVITHHETLQNMNLTARAYAAVNISAQANVHLRSCVYLVFIFLIYIYGQQFTFVLT